MEHDQVNVAELWAGLYDGYQPIEQDTDVTIECQGQKFLCHRAVLAARGVNFEGIRNNNVSTENVTGTVVSADEHVKAAALLEVLKYMYTGNMTITSSNFVDLLHTCKYLGANELEAHCVRFMLQDRPEPIVDLLEVLSFAHSVKNESLIKVLASCNMTERLKKFFQTDEFLDISADLLSIIVSKLWRSPPIMNKVLRRAINRWKVDALEERTQDALKLYEVLEPGSKIPLRHSIGSSDSLLDVRPDLHKTVAATTNPSLYVYVVDTEDRMKMYRYNGTSMNLRSKKFDLVQSFVQDSRIRASRFVSVDNLGVFSIAHETEKCFYPTFTQFASPNICDFEHGLELASPPVNLYSNFHLHNLSNRGLYLLRRMRSSSDLPHRNPRYDASKQEFAEDEIRRGIYFYNIELDRWFPVPVMISHPLESCMTVHDNLVYVISSRKDRKMVQAYDHRERQWQRLPNVLRVHGHGEVQPCVVDGKIYISSEGYCERYDPIAARWENVEGLVKDPPAVMRLIPYQNQLWLFRRHGGIFLNFNNCIDIYDPRTATWSSISGLDAFKTIDFNDKKEKVVNGLVW